MRIAIDARLYGPSKNRGLGRYVEQLVKNLEFVDDKNEYIILLRQNNWDEYEGRNLRFKKVLADYPWYSFCEQIFLPWKLWRLNCDLVHFPHFNVPFFCPKKFVVTIHDLIMYKFPDERATTRNRWFYKIKYWLHKMVVKSAVRRAEGVITDSEFTKRDIVREFGLDEGKIKVIYLGFEVDVGDAGNAGNVDGKTSASWLKDKFGIRKPYLLYVGSAYPHKNLERLILAFKLVKEKHKDLQLVLVGKEDCFYKRVKQFSKGVFQSDLDILAKKEGITKLNGDKLSNKEQRNDKVVFTGRVSNGELAKLYQNAAAYVFPSLYEGFGLPGLEAMSYGVPVIAARASCLPEIYGEAAMYFEPKSEKDLAEKISRILGDKGLRRELVIRGYEQIKKYSWRRGARETLWTYTHLRAETGGV